MSFLYRAGVAATRSTRVVQKRFGSHTAHHGPEAPPTQEGFTSSGFKLTLLAVVGLIAWSRIDEHLTNQGEEKHPFTRYIEYYMRSEQESNRLNQNHIQLAQQAAEERKFFNEASLPPKIQLRYPDLMNNASGKLIEAGSAVSMDNVVAKYH
ncbi:hypothetical protein BC939DRAFT_461983 [Gamsiella multidivaricata]|uniref:uncharacterized protein n=1 Tax=Gamsiella multidivaricata TaxID=101098 RepID=UPI00222112F3|nr:uncharacterized protein BC939DRAFT_461983 [Gamsiella multidivaricata]KAG0358213.1 hypothetical protein BGZ54_010537 [Gamsiella multidivaricata]KAI7818778.1 hypothetical protein BC939DRAFT_461983 [Gamsiella multidivaricata]